MPTIVMKVGLPATNNRLPDQMRFGRNLESHLVVSSTCVVFQAGDLLILKGKLLPPVSQFKNGKPIVVNL
jgi:hypothetical protein